MYRNDPNLTLKGGIYGSWMIDNGLWAIHSGNATMYLICGSNKALLIDTGFGKGDLPAYLAGITSLGLTVVNTHTHYDHSSGNAFFRKVRFGESGDKDALASTVKKLPYPDYKISHLKNGQLIDLGGRTVEVITIGAHHESSCAFLDHQSRSLFTGDELEAGQVLLNVRGDEVKTEEIVRKHLANMKKLKQREGEFDRIFPAHNGAPLDISYIDDFIGLSQGILDHSVSPCSTVAGFGWSPMIFGGDSKLVRYRFNKASFICRKEN